MAPNDPSKAKSAKPVKSRVTKAPSKTGRPKASASKSSPSKASTSPSKVSVSPTKAAGPRDKTLAIQNNLLFLWSCFLTTNTAVNFNTVAEDSGINAKAARMRFTRLKRVIEKIKAEANDNEDAHEDAAESEDGGAQLQGELIESIEKNEGEEEEV